MLFRVPDIERDGENKLGQLIHQSGFSVTKTLDEQNAIGMVVRTWQIVYIVQHDRGVVPAVFLDPSQLCSLISESGSVRLEGTKSWCDLPSYRIGKYDIRNSMRDQDQGRLQLTASDLSCNSGGVMWFAPRHWLYCHCYSWKMSVEYSLFLRTSVTEELACDWSRR